MVKDHSDSRHMDYSVQLAAQFFYMHHPTDRIPHTTAFVTPVGEHWLEWEIVQWRIDPMTHRTMSKCSYQRSYISLLKKKKKIKKN